MKLFLPYRTKTVVLATCFLFSELLWITKISPSEKAKMPLPKFSQMVFFSFFITGPSKNIWCAPSIHYFFYFLWYPWHEPKISKNTISGYIGIRVSVKFFGKCKRYVSRQKCLVLVFLDFFSICFLCKLASRKFWTACHCIVCTFI